MHLLNVHTRLLEQFLGTSRPPYAILSHTWGEGEAKFEDYCAEGAHVDSGPPQPKPRPRHRRARTRLELGRAPRRVVRSLQQRAEPSRQRRRRHQGPGHAKIAACCRQAKAEGFDYVWIDTCCIDKRSSAELSEAINTMFRWYKEADCCYVFLADVPSVATDASLSSPGESLPSPVGLPPSQREAFKSSRWFRRGWTLHELLAPETLQFFDADWSFIGIVHREISDPQWATKLPDLASMVSQITDIPHVLLQHGRISSISVAQRMSWASGRETTREEDMAYCLLGIFDVNMPLLYGEGQKAFERLQEEIIRTNSDQSIFAFGAVDCGTSPLSDQLLFSTSQPDLQDSRKHLARSPRDFAGSSVVAAEWPRDSSAHHHVTTHMGISMSVKLFLLSSGELLLPMKCTAGHPNSKSARQHDANRICLVVQQRVQMRKNVLEHRRDGYMTLFPLHDLLQMDNIPEQLVYIMASSEGAQPRVGGPLTIDTSFLDRIHVRATFPEYQAEPRGYRPYHLPTGAKPGEISRHDTYLDCVLKKPPPAGEAAKSFALRVLHTTKDMYRLDYRPLDRVEIHSAELFVSHHRDRYSMVELMLQAESRDNDPGEVGGSETPPKRTESTWEECSTVLLDDLEIYLFHDEEYDMSSSKQRVPEYHLCVRTPEHGKNPVAREGVLGKEDGG